MELCSINRQKVICYHLEKRPNISLSEKWSLTLWHICGRGRKSFISLCCINWPHLVHGKVAYPQFTVCSSIFPTSPIHSRSAFLFWHLTQSTFTSHAISSYSRVAGVEFTAYRAELGNLKLSPGTKWVASAGGKGISNWMKGNPTAKPIWRWLYKITIKSAIGDNWCTILVQQLSCTRDGQTNVIPKCASKL